MFNPEGYTQVTSEVASEMFRRVEDGPDVEEWDHSPRRIFIGDDGVFFEAPNRVESERILYALSRVMVGE